jgi:chromosome segregation ATPase
VRPIKEDVIEQAFVKALNSIVANKESFRAKLDKLIEQAVKANEQANAESVTQAAYKQNLESQLGKHQQELISLSQSKCDVDDKTARSQVGADGLISKIQYLQSDIELCNSIVCKCTHGTQSINTVRLAEMKKLITKPLDIFNDKIFGAMVDKVFVQVDGNRPCGLKFVLVGGMEAVELISKAIGLN